MDSCWRYKLFLSLVRLESQVLQGLIKCFCFCKYILYSQKPCFFSNCSEKFLANSFVTRSLLFTTTNNFTFGTSINKSKYSFNLTQVFMLPSSTGTFGFPSNVVTIQNVNNIKQTVVSKLYFVQFLFRCWVTGIIRKFTEISFQK